MLLSPIRSPIRSPLYSPLAKGGGGAPVYPIDDVGGVAPAFAYSTAKLRSAYAGPAVRVLRPTDSAEMDIGFLGASLDTGALSLFLGAGFGRVLRFYDQSGNDNHSAIQATDALRASIGRSITFGSHPALVWANGIYELPPISWNTRAISAYCVIDQDGALEGTFQFGPDDGNWQFYLNGGLNGTSPPIRGQNRSVVTEYLSGPSSFIQSQGQETSSASALPAATKTGGRLGFPTSGFAFSGLRACDIAYDRVLSSEERTRLKASLDAVFGTAVVPGRVVYVGDSLTVGSSAGGNYGYARRSQRLLTKSIAAYRNAVGGATIQNYAAGYATSFAHFVLTTFSDNRVVFLHMGTNDIAGGRSAAQVYADIVTFAGNVRSDGGKVITSTILPNVVFDAPKRAILVDVNAQIRANWATYADGFADFQADPTMGPPAAVSNSALYADGTHPTDAGHALLAPIAAAAINALL